MSVGCCLIKIYREGLAITEGFFIQNFQQWGCEIAFRFSFWKCTGLVQLYSGNFVVSTQILFQRLSGKAQMG